MRLALALYANSLFASVLSSPLVDVSTNTKQLLLTSHDSMGLPGMCKPRGALCDWPPGTRGPCCSPFLCVSLTTDETPYLVCA
ncbi:hypothetical protein JVU11DRAFT_8051 [Chiua virens]|nr:hypothetical protein JVU11DRAFT_8051 [Chiua virens]